MKYFLTVFLLSLLTLSASAQITITPDEFIQGYIAANLFSYNSTSDPSQFDTLVTLNGTNKVWDFSPYSYVGQHYSYVGQQEAEKFLFLSVPPGAPFLADSDFAEATNVFQVFTPGVSGWQYVFVKIDSSGFWLIGDVIDSFDVSSYIQLQLTPPFQQQQFPLTYQTAWQSTSEEYSPDQTPGTSHAVTAVTDGYGTLILPGSGPLQTLRQKILWTTTYAHNGQNVTDSSYEFQWLTREGYTVTIDADSKQNPMDLYYSVPLEAAVSQPSPTVNLLALRFSENPASASTRVLITVPTSGFAQIEIMDELGRSVRMLENGFETAGEHSVTIDPNSLNVGTYFVRILVDGESAMQKLIVE